jgi:hypothetical protein
MAAETSNIAVSGKSVRLPTLDVSKLDKNGHYKEDKRSDQYDVASKQAYGVSASLDIRQAQLPAATLDISPRLHVSSLS